MALTGSTTDALFQLKSHEGNKRDSQNIVPIVIDDLLKDEVGPCGIWQWSLVILAVTSTAATSNFPNFFDTQPRQRCHMGTAWEREFSRAGFNFDQIVKLTGGSLVSDQNFFGCHRYQANWNYGPLEPLLWTNITKLPVYNLTNQIESCPEGFVYEFSSNQYHGGIVAEMNLVCDRRWMVPVGTSLFMIGMILGYLFCGFWAGRFGRKNALIFFSLLELSSLWLCSFVHNYWIFSTLRIIVAIGTYAKLSAFSLIILEITIAQYRSIFNALAILGFNCVGRLILVAIACYVSNWRALNFLASLNCVLTLIYFFVVPESPRWLLSQGRPLDAVRVLQRGRRINHLLRPGTAPSEMLERICEQECSGSAVNNASQEDINHHSCRVIQPSSNSVRKNFIDVLSSWTLVRITIFSILIFNAYAFTFMGLVLYTRMIRASVFLVSFLNALITIPGTVIAMIIYRVFRRRRLPLVLVCFVCGAALLAGGLYTFLMQPKEDLVLTIALELGLMFFAAMQCLLFIYIPELYPPALRSQGFGLAAGFGRAGSAGATFANALNYTVKHAMPMLLYAGVTLAVGLLVLCLPDTTGEEREEKKTTSNSIDKI